MDEWIKKFILNILEYFLAIKKEGNLAICNNMDGPQGHDAKWNKSDRETQILYDLSYM